MMKYFCCTEQRRELVRAHPTLNGMDFLEVEDDPSMPKPERQRRLDVHFLKSNGLAALTKDNFRLTGGEAVTNLSIETVSASGTVVTIEVNPRGDFTTYTLHLVDVDLSATGFDPLLAAVDFSFKVNCLTDFDCRETRRPCPPASFPEPDLNYLAKDFNSFRQLMLDRLSVTLPDWREQSAADLLQVLIDLKAYVADYQSYQQDAVATEAYLETARRRVSVRRHARLVDYRMHDGCNARTWAQVTIDPGIGLDAQVELPARTMLFTRVAGARRRLQPETEELQRALGASPVIFETLHAAALYARHNRLCFYTWGETECCLPAGATGATLDGDFPNLQANDILILEEVRGPQTGSRNDADLRRRHAVKLLQVRRPLLDPLNNQPITEIEWHAEDALPFALTLSAAAKIPASELDGAEDGLCVTAFAVARGNVVLCDQGRTIPAEDLGTVPAPQLNYVVPAAPCREASEADALNRRVPVRFRPRLKEKPLTQAVPYKPALSARAHLQVSSQDAVPAIQLKSELAGLTNLLKQDWNSQRDLLSSDGLATDFVAEIEDDGSACLRFGDDRFGMRPNEGTAFRATYRSGNGRGGNIGAEGLSHIVTNLNEIVAVRNPLPAVGGTEPETLAEVRLKAPHAYRVQERAVTPEDYVTIAERHPEVQRAVASFRWTGSWHTVFLTVDRLGGRALDPDFEADLRAYLDGYRMMGYDLEVDAPHFVPLEIEMEVCVQPDYFRGDVRRALLAAFSPRVTAEGRQGLFHPDNFTFGQTVFLSRIYTAAQAVAGVESVRITRFQRQDNPASSGLESGRLLLGRLEIARLDNDPNFPKRGILRITPQGGK
jgi:hypothetical protein